VRRDHRPYYLKRAYLRLQRLYAVRFLTPQLESQGRGCHFIKPWHVEIFGGPVHLADFVQIIAAGDQKVRLTVWPKAPGEGAIYIGRAALLCPGVRISAASRVTIGPNCMLASRAYVTDADWHGLYNRIQPVGRTAPVELAENVWIGDSAIVCKGVTIGGNSVIGAGSVVRGDIPANCIAAGNPARVLRTLDPDSAMTTRGDWFSDPRRLSRDWQALDRAQLAGNSLLKWLRTIVRPQRGD
jgi:acetyltransferase-like isoleucine patch superfamily enzyme